MHLEYIFNSKKKNKYCENDLLFDFSCESDFYSG